MLQVQSAPRSQPPLYVLGMAALVGYAYRQGDLAAVWSLLLDRYTVDMTDAAALMDMSVVVQAAGHRQKGLDLQRQALTLSRSYTCVHGNGDGLRLLAFVAEGDFKANTPVDFLLEGSDIVLTLYYIDAATTDLSDVPEHDIAFVAVGESEANAPILANLERLLHGWKRPVMNGALMGIAALTRDGVASMLADESAILAPRTARVDRTALQKLSEGQVKLAQLLPNASFPIIVRPLDSQGGEGLAKIEAPEQMDAYLAEHSDPWFFIAPFINYASADGLFRKWRIAFIDGRPFASHLAISEHWIVHYLSSGMLENEAWRAEEAAWMQDFDHASAVRHAAAFAALVRTFGLDYFVIDCAELPDGRLLLFEAQVAMIVHAMDATGVFSYKETAMQKLFGAFRSALDRRCRRGIS